MKGRKKTRQFDGLFIEQVVMLVKSALITSLLLLQVLLRRRPLHCQLCCLRVPKR